ncbi:MAG: tetratricopeptide repeat protein [Desulfobacteraceae bacterium]|nr:tetratricopeptide repeat protein [Desulfobacteraceae bacterium]
MGLFSIFAGKKPEDHEERGDECLRNKAFGDARIEFEKALHKIETRFAEKKHLTDRIQEKLFSASESLAEEHIKNAEALAEAGDTAEAAEFCQLAMDLTKKEKTRQRITQAMQQIAEKSGEKQIPSREAESGQSRGASTDNRQGRDSLEPDMEDGNDEELFTVLLNALPHDTAEVYRQYGNSFARGYTALNRGDFDKAIEELSAAMEENKEESTLISLELATAYLHAENHGRARQLLESFIRQNPKEIRAYHLLCDIYWEAGEFVAASQLIESAPPEIRRSSFIELLDGETRFQAGDLEGARTVFNACIEENGADEIVLRSLAKTCEAAGDIEDARELYAQIMNHCTSCQAIIDPFIKRRYAELSFESGDISPKLLDLFFSLVQEDPDNRGVYYLHIGRIYEKLGEQEQAGRYLWLAGQLEEGS